MEITSMRASRAGCMSGVWNAPLTARGSAFIAPAAVASVATCARIWPNETPPSTNDCPPDCYSGAHCEGCQSVSLGTKPHFKHVHIS